MPKIFGKNTKFEKRELSLPHYFAYYFLMKKKLLLFLTLLAFSSAAHLSAQRPVSWRVKHLTADSLILRIDTLSVKPQIFHIQGVNKSQYRLDPLTSPALTVAISLIFNVMKILLISCKTCVLPSGWMGMFRSEMEAITSTSSEILPEICRFSDELRTRSWLFPTETPREIDPFVYNSLLFNTSSSVGTGYSRNSCCARCGSILCEDLCAIGFEKSNE